MMMNINMEMGNKILKLALVVAAVYVGMKFLFPVALPFLIALVLARLLYPLALFFEKKTGCNKSVSRLAAYGVFLACVGMVVAGILYLGYCMGSGFMERLDGLIESGDELLGRCCEGLEGMTGISTEEIKRTVGKEATGLTDGAVQYSKEAGWYLVGLLAKTFVAFVAAFLVLNDYESIRDGFAKTQAGRYTIRMFGELKTALGAYLRAQFCIMGIITAVCIAGLFILRIRYAFWVGIFVGIFDALPFFGTGTIFVPWALIKVLTGEYLYAAGFVGIYFVCSLIRQLLEPKMVGHQLGVPPLAVLMSLYIGVQVYGGSGVLLGPLSVLIIYKVYKFL